MHTMSALGQKQTFCDDPQNVRFRSHARDGQKMLR